MPGRPSGVLSFGLVSVPEQLYSATEAHGPTFHQFEEGTADRIRYERSRPAAPGRWASTRSPTPDEIDPVYVNKTYFPGPGDEEAMKPYALLRAAGPPTATNVASLEEASQASVDAGRKAPGRRPAAKRTAAEQPNRKGAA